jgi:hypothetical protein
LSGTRKLLNQLGSEVEEDESFWLPLDESDDRAILRSY